MEFETARQHLATWYRLGHPKGDPSFRTFFEGWLKPVAKACALKASKGKMPADGFEDALQLLATEFADRERLVGLDAETPGFWVKRVKWRLGSAHRSARADDRRKVYDTLNTETGEIVSAVDAVADRTENVEVELGRRELERRRLLAIEGTLSELTPAERVAYLAWLWPDSQPLLSTQDFDEMRQRSGLSADAIRAALTAAVPYRDKTAEWARRTVVVLAPADQLATVEGRTTALDTYRKARSRASARLAGLNRGLFDGGEQ